MKLGTPDMSVIKFIQKIGWSAGSGHLNLLHATNEEIHKTYEKEKVTLHHSTDFEIDCPMCGWWKQVYFRGESKVR